MSHLKVAVIGVGALGQYHAEKFAAMADVDLVGVADFHEEAGTRVAEKCGTRWVADYRELLDEVDAVSIAVPTVAHLAVAGDCLLRGIPAMVEKPLALDSHQGAQLVKLAEQTGTVLQVGHIERFNPATIAARPFIKKPKYIRGERLSPFTFRSTDIGVTFDLMIHDIDLVLDLAGAPVESIEAFGMSIMGEHEDVAQARLRFQNGCVADLTANRVSLKVSRQMQVWSADQFVGIDYGERKVTTCAPSPSLLSGASPVELAMQPGADINQLKQDVFGRFIKVDSPNVILHDALEAELRSFVECVRHGRQPVVDGHAGLAALQVAERVVQAVAAHSWEAQTGPGRAAA